MSGRCCPFEQHDMELNLMEQMEHMNIQFGYAFSKRRTFGDGGEVVMGDIIVSRSELLTSTCFQLFVSLWRFLDHNFNTVRRYLAIVKVFLNDIDGAAEGLNQRQKVWVEQLRIVAGEGHSIVDAYPEDNGFLFLFRKIIFARNIDRLLKEIINISKRKEIYGIANIQIRGRQSVLEGDNPGVKENPLVAQPDSCSHRHITEFEKEFQLIKGEKQLMNALFDDVQEIGYEKLDERSKIWVDQMKKIVPELDLVIKECACELKQVTLLNNILGSKARFHIMDKIKNIRKKIKDAGRSRKACSLVQRQSQAESLCRKTQPLLIAKESRMVGFDEDVEILMAQLLSDEKHQCICSIVGTKGTGKTALASFIYRSEAVLSHFDCVIWVTPSSTAEPLKNQIAKKAAEIIMGGEHDMWTTQVVLTTLATKKYLIVVDGIQTAHVLDTLREAIPDRLTASRFLLTTSNAIDALRACSRSFFVHPLRLLDDENSWILLMRKLSVKMNLEPKLQEIQEIGKKIMAKCGGLPLEILKMSKLLLHKDLTAEEWAKVLEQPNEDQNTWSETLDTVNANLPSYLRRCLFYFELFPADFEIPVRRLVALWVAEGLVPLGEDQEWPPELVAERYLIELIDLNMVQIAKRKRNGKVKTCRFANGLRQIFKSTESRIPQVGGTSTDLEAVPKNSRIRRVADHLEVKDIWHMHIHGNSNTSARDCDSLRTYYQSVFSFLSFDTRLASKPGHDIGNFLNLCILNNCLLQLRVLDLEGVYKPKLPKNIAKLSGLRYLGLRWTYLKSLSPSISSLLQLQTLDLKHTYIQTLPSSIWKMKLRHLSLSESNRTGFPPKPIGIDIGRSLHDLQTLWGVLVDEETPVKGGLDKLVNITKLGITCRSESSSQLDAVSDWIVKLQYLQSLRLKSRDKQGRPWKIHLKFLQHHTNLTDLYLLGCLNTPLNHLFLPPTLVVLTLSHTKLDDDPMQILKDAPNLRSLSLFAESYLGRTIVCKSESFSQLRVLRVWKLEQLEEWKIEQKALPSLRQLEIRLCPRMKVLPDGLNHVNSLLELKLTNMPMEINTEKHNIPLNCEVHRDDPARYEEQFVYTALSERKFLTRATLKFV